MHIPRPARVSGAGVRMGRVRIAISLLTIVLSHACSGDEALQGTQPVLAAGTASVRERDAVALGAEDFRTSVAKHDREATRPTDLQKLDFGHDVVLFRLTTQASAASNRSADG